MRSVRHKLFNKAFDALTPAMQAQARLAFAKWQTDPQQVGWKRLAGMKSNLYSAEIGYGSRAIALVTRDARGEALACWIWAGSHEAYNNFIEVQRQRTEQTFTQGLTAAQRGATLSDRVRSVNGTPAQAVSPTNVSQPKSRRSPTP
jgi:hypothetical protein